MRNASNKSQVPSVSEWSAYPQDVATMTSIDDDVSVLASLQKPKKLTIVGSDGHRYAFLCKPKVNLNPKP
jgi:serine/threonine-protein kinase ATR